MHLILTLPPPHSACSSIPCVCSVASHLAAPRHSKVCGHAYDYGSITKAIGRRGQIACPMAGKVHGVHSALRLCVCTNSPCLFVCCATPHACVAAGCSKTVSKKDLEVDNRLAAQLRAMS